MVSIQSVLEQWHSDDKISGNICAWKTIPSCTADVRALPDKLNPCLTQALTDNHIYSLYSHQNEAWEYLQNGKNIIVVTGTASGKSLCYNLPVLNHLCNDISACALYIFPTKALAQDQMSILQKYLQNFDKGISNNLVASIYDGDTTGRSRSQIRNRARIIFTNPDMLHIGILPYHARWANFFSRLRFIILDEAHIYRGVFGSHVANVIRRLKRIAHFYRSNPIFILTSATIANPIELAEHLIEDNVTLVDKDGSSRGKKHFIIYNPPIINQELGLRASLTQETLRFAEYLLAQKVQTILFGRSRHMIEMMLKLFKEKVAISSYEFDTDNKHIRGYRSGYLPKHRREIENGIRSGNVSLVITTNALELGIDIGGMEAVLIAGYPGTITATRQQAGRAGRGENESLAILITTSSPLDQFLAHHPEYIFEKSPEKALVNPNHLAILINHLQCALFELPFEDGSSFGNMHWDSIKDILEYLQSSGIINHSSNKYFWKSQFNPAENMSIRSATQERILLQTEEGTTIGELDRNSALWMVHPGAVYLHEANPFLVDTLDLDKKLALLHPIQEDYYTEPLKETTVQLIQVLEHKPVLGAEIMLGEILVTTKIVSFRRILWQFNEVIDEIPLNLPSITLQTTAYWITISQQTIGQLEEEGVWLGKPNYYGSNWDTQRNLARTRDMYRCQLCGKPEITQAHHVHHKIPFRLFSDIQEANDLSNLITLCSKCHQKVEVSVRMRSGLAGLSYTMAHLAPLFLMCDLNDIGVHADIQSQQLSGDPTIVIYDQAPGGIGFSHQLFQVHNELMENALELLKTCECSDGCPSCVGPGGENGHGGKSETLSLLTTLTR
ncbi:MAG: DEAD/DEAH box helicase [Chloroflexota bacterium]